jgi:hypothetical protein
MKALTYFFCLWFTIIACGCAAQRTEIPAEMTQPASSTTGEPAKDCSAPAAPPPLEERPLQEAARKTLAIVTFPFVAIVFVPWLWLAFTLGGLKG